MKLYNIFINFFLKKQKIVIINKIFKRLSKKNNIDSRKWAIKKCESFEDFAKKINNDILIESINYSKYLNEYSSSKLKDLNVVLGGGAFCSLLYFITRLKKPKVILETGVAAGFSSRTFLDATKKNGIGKLYSSDFPYFRIKNPEKFIGLLVNDDFKNNWTLSIEGDEFALPKFVKKLKKIDIFHYDSDKSYRGRFEAVSNIKSIIDDETILIFDDIQDNFFFRDFVNKYNKNYKIFKSRNKYVGFIFNKLT